jgi:hypothetical protein
MSGEPMVKLKKSATDSQRLAWSISRCKLKMGDPVCLNDDHPGDTLGHLGYITNFVWMHGSLHVVTDQRHCFPAIDLIYCPTETDRQQMQAKFYDRHFTSLGAKSPPRKAVR